MKKIILVDDSESYRSRVKRDLENNNVTIIKASNGEKGFAFVKKTKIRQLF